MAKVINGLLSGKVGNLIYFIIEGKQFVRAYVKPDNPGTPGQRRQRARIKTCSKFMSQMKNAVMIGYQGRKTDAFCEAMKYNMANALEETTPPETTDFSFKPVPEKVMLSQGNINYPLILSCIREGDIISITWDDDLGQYPNRYTDVMAMAAWVPGLKAHIQLNTGMREAGAGQITLPLGFTGEVHLWCFYWNGEKGLRGNKNNVSNSVYLGVK